MQKHIDAIKELMPNMRRQLPGDIAFVGVGIAIANEFNLATDIGVVAVIVGISVMMMRNMFSLRQDRMPAAKEHPLQSQINDARSAGYRVWKLVPRNVDTASPALSILREEGYVITDKNGDLIDAALERLDSPSMRRRAFRLVETEAETIDPC